ncbi:MAG: lipocalin family protein [Bacteroidales bacterium]
MRKLMVCLIACLSISVMFTSCGKDDETTFDESLLIGKWVSGTEHYKYLSDYTGATWDTADDVTEAEAQTFTWSLDKAELTIVHDMEIKGVPKVYTVTELTSTTLKYKDSFGTQFSYSKESK